jgi:hypothetical protein
MRCTSDPHRFVLIFQQKFLRRKKSRLLCLTKHVMNMYNSYSTVTRRAYIGTREPTDNVNLTCIDSTHVKHVYAYVYTIKKTNKINFVN